jgi:hypothetical protein
MIQTYSNYIQKYTLETGGMHSPGEHHFVATYLVPMLHKIPFLGVPDYVNPDGMKGIPGDIVYYDRNSKTPWRMKLRIEVKIGSLKFSRTEYNEWMTDEATANARPQVFIGISNQGLLIGDWDAFADRFKSVVYPNGSAPALLNVASKAERYTRSRDLTKVVHDPDKVLPEALRQLPESLHWFPRAKDDAEATQYELAVTNLLTQMCRKVIDDSGETLA